MASAQQPLSWTVTGKGAIGLLAACRLQQASIPVTLWLRQGSNARLDVMFHQADTVHNLHFALARHTEQLSFVFMPVKTYDVLTCFTRLQSGLAHNAQLVLSHNGMGIAEQLLPLLAPQQGLWFLSTSQGAMKTADNTVIHRGSGQSYLAPMNQAAQCNSQPVISAMQSAFPPLQVVADITPFLWQKLAVNAVINPLTAIYQCPNGDLLQPQYREQITAIVSETCAVAAAAGQQLLPEDTLETVLHVAEKTAANYSSMQQDVAAKRKTEINAINGYLVQQAGHYGIDVPQNNRLLQLITRTEAAYGR